MSNISLQIPSIQSGFNNFFIMIYFPGKSTYVYER